MTQQERGADDVSAADADHRLSDEPTKQSSLPNVTGSLQIRNDLKLAVFKIFLEFLEFRTTFRGFCWSFCNRSLLLHMIKVTTITLSLQVSTFILELLKPTVHIHSNVELLISGSPFSTTPFNYILRW